MVVTYLSGPVLNLRYREIVRNQCRIVSRARLRDLHKIAVDWKPRPYYLQRGVIGNVTVKNKRKLLQLNAY
jgi:hypothetical protein